MAIFNKHSNKQESKNHSETTVIACGANIKGEFNFECRLHVDGYIEGIITSENIIVIGKKGTVKGDLKAEKLAVSGCFEGNAECSHVEVLEGGVFSGSVTSEELMIESKAKFEGESKLKTKNPKNEDLPLLDSIKKEIELDDNKKKGKKS